MKKQNIVALLLLIILAVAAGFYFYPQYRQNQAEQEENEQVSSMTTLVIVDQNLDQETIDKYNQIFDTAKKIFLENLSDPVIAFQALVRMGMIKQFVGDYQGAEEIWLYTHELSPGSYVVNGNLAHLYKYFINDYQKAEEFYLQALDAELINADANHYTYFKELYELYRYQFEDLGKAEALLDRAIEELPDSAGVYNMAGDYYRTEGNDLQRARQYYNQALEIDPENSTAKNGLEKLNS